MFRFIIFVICIGVVFGGECERRHGGECHSLYMGCPSGFSHYTVSYCGFLQQCCYTDGDSGHAHNTSSSPFTSGACGLSSVNDRQRIVGGHMTKAAEYPWQVTLMYHGQHMCGGTLIDNHHVITAAHCFERTSHRYWTVGMGIANIAYVSASTRHKVSRIIAHQDYDPDTSAYDIALVILSSPVDVTGNDVRTACLPRPKESFEGRMCTVTGWGQTGAGTDPDHLREVDIPVISNSLCGYYLGRQAGINPRTLCAGLAQGGKDACQGDSGGPLVCKKDGVWKLAGIVSWGYGCAEERTPGVYTRVSEYIDWISSASRR